MTPTSQEYNLYNTKIQIAAEETKLCPTTEKIQIGLRVLKITDGVQSLPRPSRRDSQANVVSLQPVACMWNRSPRRIRRSVLQSTGKQNSTRYQCFEFQWERGQWLERQQATLITMETRYNIRLKRRDKRAYRNN